MSALVASDATAPKPVARSVAKTTVAKGEMTVGAPRESTSAVTPGEIGALKPTTETARARPKKQPPTRKILPGDLICGDCGEGNQPTRNFCSRCGSTLKNAQVKRRRWWQRFVPRRRKKALEAGARPWKEGKAAGKPRRGKGKLGAIYSKVRPIVAAALLLSALVVGFSPDLRGKVTGKIGDAKNSVMSKLNPTYVPLSPISVRGTSFEADHPATQAIDGNTLTSWIVSEADPEKALTVRFDEPFDLERIKLWNGASEGFKDNARVQTIHFVFDTGSTFDLVIEDLPDGKDYEIDGGSGIREAELFITSAYSSLGSDDIQLSEIEFLFRR